jgi:drug/metabolite transporter (DMT)-like permease
MGDISGPKQRGTGPLLLAFTVLYISWGTTYLPIHKGVQIAPPFLFSGLRLVFAGLLILAFLWWRGESLRLTRRELGILCITGCFFFLGGNGLLALALQHNKSGLTAVITSPSPLYVVLLELLIPRGDRLTWRGWLGLFLGLGGVLLLSLRTLTEEEMAFNTGLWFSLGSTLSWAIGSLWTRHAPLEGSPFRTGGYQLLIGGLGLSLLGLILGEGSRMTAQQWPPMVCFYFCYLLVVGSLLGFLAFNYVLAHTSTAMAGTYAYVNPVVALFVAAWLDGEQITPLILVCMALILSGVALVKMGGVRPRLLAELSVTGEARVHLTRPGVHATRQ